ncbi:MAG TPA: hypothetical protein VN603_06605 [Candidatus Acidoferrales bacterium]|nr:hypothetical protein [Candidatus Acidoferrales bacterium]
MSFKLPHDLGGEAAGPVDRSEHASAFWEQRVDAIRELTRAAKLDGEPLIRVDEMRRTIEGFGTEAYEGLSYYEKWIRAMTSLLLEKGVITTEELGNKLAEIDARESGT